MTFTEAWNDFTAFVNSNAMWTAAIAGCTAGVSELLATGEISLAITEAAACAGKLAAEFVAFNFTEALPVFGLILSAGPFDQGGTMACTNFHKSSQKVQGPGLCCAQVGVAGGLVAPPPGTILPTYQPGQADAGTIPAGRIVQVTDAAGHCASCMIVGSKSKKHPGKPVLMFVRGGPACPTAGTGCCAL